MPVPCSLLSREAQLLVLTAGGPANEAPLRRLLASQLNWPTVGAMARAERATPIVWQWLQRLGADCLPVEVATVWRKLAMVSEFESLRLEQRLHESVAALATRGIEVMLLKGSALAYTAYAAFAERPMGDLDLLVHPEQAREAWSILQTLGWTWPATRWPAERYTVHQHLPPLVDAHGQGFRLELHTDLLPGGQPFRLSADTLWRDAQPICLDGRTTLVPDPLQHLLHLCVHFAWSHQMQWASWRTFRDVQALTRRGDIPWATFVDLARDSRATTCCFWTLRLARDLARVTVPNDVLRALHPPLPEFLLDRLEHHYVLELFPTENSCPSVKLGRWLWEVGIAPRRSEHGAGRPWQVSHGWCESVAADTWPRRLLNRARHIGASLGYVGRLLRQELGECPHGPRP